MIALLSKARSGLPNFAAISAEQPRCVLFSWGYSGPVGIRCLSILFPLQSLLSAPDECMRRVIGQPLRLLQADETSCNHLSSVPLCLGQEKEAQRLGLHYTEPEDRMTLSGT